MDIKEDWLSKRIDKKLKENGINVKVKPGRKLADKLHKLSISNFKKKEQFIQDLKTIFGVLI